LLLFSSFTVCLHSFRSIILLVSSSFPLNLVLFTLVVCLILQPVAHPCEHCK
jgi:hypothetical protein